MKYVFSEKDQKTIPKEVYDLIFKLNFDNQIYPVSSWENHEQIVTYVETGKYNLYTFFVTEELLAVSKRRDKCFVKIIREKILSQIEEVVHRLWMECNNELTDLVKKEQKQGLTFDKALQKIKAPLYQEAERQLKEELRESYPRSWRKKFRKNLINKERWQFDYKRLYKMPYPWNSWDYRNSWVQTYVIEDDKGHCIINQGASASSGARERHSIFSFAFAQISKGKSIPTYFLHYDENNIFTYLGKIPHLCLYWREIGSNYHLKPGNYPNIFKNVGKIYYDTGFLEQREWKIEVEI